MLVGDFLSDHIILESALSDSSMSGPLPDVSLDVDVFGFPSWGLFVDVFDFVDSHKDWLLYAVDVRFQQTHRSSSSMVNSVEAFTPFTDFVSGSGGLAFLFSQVLQSSAPFKDLDDMVVVGYHVKSPFYVLGAAPTFSVLLAVAAGEESVLGSDSSNYAFRHRFSEIPDVSTHMVVSSSLRAPLNRFYTKIAWVVSNGRSFVSLDNNVSHVWLHDMLAVCSSPSVRIVEDMFCVTSHPVAVADMWSRVRHQDPALLANVKNVMMLSSVALSDDCNMFRFHASAFLGTLSSCELEEAVVNVFEVSPDSCTE